MGYLRDRYGEADQIDSKWIKFTRVGQVYTGTVVKYEEGRFGTDVIFADDKRITLNNAVLLREVVKADPDPGDRLEITYLGDEPPEKGSTRSPTKLYKVLSSKNSGSAPAPIDESDEPF